MALTLTDLVDVDLDVLATSVTDWKNIVGELKEAADSARTGMKARSDAAAWAGVNAAVTRGFIDRTAKEISDLHIEANSVHRVLDDGHTELLALQQQVRQAVDVDAAALGVRVEDIGDGTVRCVFPHLRGDTDERTQSRLDAKRELEGRIARILTHATEIDATVARALARSHGSDPHNAGHSAYESLNDAQVERALEIARPGDGMSDAELRELNRLLQFNASEADGKFATEFYEGLGGPEQAHRFYAEMAIDGTDAEATETHLNAVQDLRRVMGHALVNANANATDPDPDPDNRHRLHAGWGNDFRRLGTQEIGWLPGQTNKPYGYQVLGGLLRHGTYDGRPLPHPDRRARHPAPPGRSVPVHDEQAVGQPGHLRVQPLRTARHRQRSAHQRAGGARPQPRGVGTVLHPAAGRLRRGRHRRTGRRRPGLHLLPRPLHRRGVRVVDRHQ
ncbi:hypothetical protein AB0O01_23055 [Streptomyces sp. NPDC093252]|uniref:hypothetical protein n=1 Tax=Streptomyces sp. NPDC093252 TaxID=3154980 RepID=UPI00344AA46F